MEQSFQESHVGLRFVFPSIYIPTECVDVTTIWKRVIVKMMDVFIITRVAKKETYYEHSKMRPLLPMILWPHLSLFTEILLHIHRIFHAPACHYKYFYYTSKEGEESGTMYFITRNFVAYVRKRKQNILPHILL